MNPSDLFEKLTAMADRRSQDEFLRQIASENPAIAQTLREMLSNFAPDDPFLETPAIEQLAQQENNSEFLEALEVKLQEPRRYNKSDLDLDFLTPSSTSETLGTLAGYEVYEILGYGGSGIVFRVLDPNLGKWFAIKVMHPDQVEDLVARKRFLQEARTLAKIDHENIVRIYRVEESPLPFLVMELVLGHSLDQAIDRTGGIELEQFLSISIQVAQGLAVAHEQGIVHRDIKPSNILLTRGSAQVAKLTDFGLARINSDLRLTKTGSVVGTPWYMSPEQIRDEAIDARSDLFSLGCVMYEMLCGQKPFTGTNPYFVLNNIISKELLDTKSLLVGIPEPIEELVSKLLQKEPPKRYQTAREVVRDLENCKLANYSVDVADKIACEKLIETICSPISDAAESLNPLPRFSEVRLIGAGAYGIVFSAVDREQKGDLIAIKMLRPSKAKDETAKHRFHDEAQNTGEVNHPSIVSVLYEGTINSIPFIVESFADRGSLVELLQRNPTFFTPIQAAWLVMNVAEGLYTAHNCGILHRDIKPANILLETDSGTRTFGLDFRPMLCDFGVSKKIVNETTLPGLTGSTGLVGTVAYMSPEQILGKKLTMQSDIFSLGIVFQEILFARHPFLEESDFRTQKNIVELNPLLPDHRSNVVPSDLVAIVEKCLRKDPTERYISAKDLAVDLSRFLKGEPVSVSSPKPWQSLWKLISQHPTFSTFLGTFIASLITFTAILGVQLQKQHAISGERMRLSELLQDSLSVTNTEINDIILSGKRVTITELLGFLEEQLTILEKAFQLDPTSEKLQRTLKVKLHYASICHFVIAEYGESPNDQSSMHSSRDTRNRSLEYIERLRGMYPSDQELMKDQINGEYWMGRIASEMNDSSEYRFWNRRAMFHAKEYLQEDPDNEPILETLHDIQLTHCEHIKKESPQEAIELLQELYDLSHTRLMNNPSSIALLSHTMAAQTDLAELLLSQDKTKESIEQFNSAEELAVQRYKVQPDDWQVRQILVTHYAERCNALCKSFQYEELTQVAQRWRQLMVSHTDWEDFLGILDFSRTNQTHSLLATYYWWLGVNRSEKTSESVKSRSLGELRDAIAKCKSNPKVDLRAMVQSLKNMNVPIEPLAELIAER